MIISRTPLRISFAGGGTDLRSFYEVEPGGVIGTAINKYIYITINRWFDKAIRISYSRTEIVNDVNEIQHTIVREALKLLDITGNIEITTMADIPARAGLGSSSSFCVGLLNALYAYKSTFVSAEKLARDACTVEIDRLGKPIGKQDQHWAAYGGLQYMQFNPDESVFVDPIVCSPETKRDLNERLMLFYTNTTRDADAILAVQRQATREPKTFATLKNMRGVAEGMKAVFNNGADLKKFGELLHQEWQYKRGLVKGITNPSIDDYYERALAAGAIGGKVGGAGGGGFLLLYCEPSKQAKVREALKELREVSFAFEPQGSKIIYVG